MRYKLIVFTFALYFFSLNHSFGDERNFNSFATEALGQFKELVRYNEKNVKEGNSHLNNYIFVYSPGKEFNPTLPPNYDFIFEHPTGTTPEGEFLNNVLTNYNNNFTDEFPYQHYVIVLNLTYVVQSKLKDNNSSESNNPEWYRAFSEDESVRDLKYYTDQKEALKTHFKNNFSFDVFADDHEYLISFFYVSHENSVKTGQKLIAKKKVELTIYGSTGNSPEFRNKWLDFIDYNKSNTSSESLNIIKSTISNYISFFYFENGLSGSNCSDLAATIFYDEARDFFEFRCTDDVLKSERKLFALYYSSLYLEYLESIYETVYNSNSTEFDFPDLEDYVAILLESYLDDDPTDDYPVYLRNNFNMYEDGIDVLKTNYHKVFYDINQPSKEILLEKIKQNINSLNTFYSYFNSLISLYPPVEMLVGIGNGSVFPSFQVEYAWKDLSKNFEYASTGAYSEDELKWLLVNVRNIQGIEQILYSKWIVGDFGGGVWKETDRIVGGTNLSNFIVRANMAYINGGLLNQISVHNIPYNYDDNYAAGTPSSKELIGSLTKTISSDYKNYSYEIPLCKEFKLVTMVEDEDEIAYRKFIKIQQCNDYYNGQFEVGFFDLVNLITLRNHFSYEDFCYEGNNSESWHSSKPVAGFYLAFADDRAFYDNLYENLTVTLQVVGTILTAGETVLASGVWRIIWGAFTVANTTSFYTANNYQEFENDLKRWFADEQEAIDWAKNIRTANELILGAEAVVGVGSIAGNYTNIFKSADYKKASAFAQMLDDAVGYVDQANLTKYNVLKEFGQANTGIYRTRNNMAELDNVYYGLYGVTNNARMVGAKGEKLKQLILKARLGGAQFKNIHHELNSLEDAGKLVDFSSDLVANPQLVNFFSAGNQVTIVARVKAWKSVIGHDVRLNTTFLEKASSLTDAQRLKLSELYDPDKFKHAAGFKGKVDYDATKTINGQPVTIHYDKNGFPDFTDYNPGSNYVYKPDAQTPPGPSLIGGKTSNGSSTDIKKANQKMEEIFDGQPTKFNWDGSSQNFKIKDSSNPLADNDGWVQYTWHHHQDGKTLFPVPTKIHSSSAGGFPHTGGAKILEKNLEGLLFDSPF